MKKIIVATNNEGKAKEFKEMFKMFNIECLTLNDIKYYDEIIEDGNSFYENALIKAKTIATKYNTICIADDSGLCVEALDNAPGIYSARYLGLDSDAKRTQAILDNLVGSSNRCAKFVCALVICYPNLENKCFMGELNGSIANNVSGTNGFGYDPIFIPNGYNISLASFSKEDKNNISHRRNALNKLMEYLNENNIF